MLAGEKIGSVEGGAGNTLCVRREDTVTCTAKDSALLSVSVSAESPFIFSPVGGVIELQGGKSKRISLAELSENFSGGTYGFILIVSDSQKKVLHRSLHEYVKSGPSARFISIVGTALREAEGGTGKENLEVTAYVRLTGIGATSSPYILRIAPSCGISLDRELRKPVTIARFDVPCGSGTITATIVRDNEVVDQLKTDFTVSVPFAGIIPVIAALLVVFLGIFAVFVIRRNGKKSIPPPSALMFILISMSLLSPNLGHAATVVLGGMGMVDFTYKIAAIGDIETMGGYDTTVTVTYPDSITPSTPYSIFYSGSALVAANGIHCLDFVGDDPACDAGDARVWATFTPGGGVSGPGGGPGPHNSGSPFGVFSGVAGFDTLQVQGRPGALFTWGCNMPICVSYPYVFNSTRNIPIVPPPPPPPPLDCGAQPVGWGAGCTGNTPWTPHANVTPAIGNTNPGYIGSSQYSCNNGALTYIGGLCIPANIPPVSFAGGDQSITLPTTSSGPSGASESDPDGFVSSRVWSFVGGPGPVPVITNPNALNAATFSGMNVVGNYVFNLAVTDNSGATTNDTMIVTVNPTPCAWSGWDTGDVGPPGKCTQGDLRGTVVLPVCDASKSGDYAFGGCAGIYQRYMQTCVCSGPPPPPPLIPSVTLNPIPVINYGGTATLSWNVANVDSCSINNGIGGVVLTGGPINSAPLTGDTTFTLTCLQGGVPISADQIARVRPSVDVSVNGSATPAPILAGAPFTLTMSSQNAGSCTWARTRDGAPDFSGVNIGTDPANVLGSPTQFQHNSGGWAVIDGAFDDYVWTFSCMNVPGTASQSGSVTLRIRNPLATLDLPIPPSDIGKGIIDNWNTIVSGVLVRNTGDAGTNLVITGISSSNPLIDPTTSSCIGVAIPFNGSVWCSVKYQPDAPDVDLATFTFMSNASNNPTSHAVFGEGVDPFNETWDMGRVPVNRTRVRDFVFNNTGPIDMPDVVIDIPAGSPYRCKTAASPTFRKTCDLGDVTGVLNGDPSETVTIEFAPLAPGKYPANAGVTATGYANLPPVELNGVGVSGDFQYCEPGDVGCVP
jgi:hypothetical protein